MPGECRPKEYAYAPSVIRVFNSRAQCVPFSTFSAPSSDSLQRAELLSRERIHWLIDVHLREHFSDGRSMIRRGQAHGSVRKGDPARLYYAVIGFGGTLLSVSSEFKVLTGRDVCTEVELRRTIAMIHDFLFI